jgi:carboxyl-terminal processing protease
MTRPIAILRALFAAGLILAGGTSVAGETALSNELLAPLTSAYMRAVKPGIQAQHHRELFASLLQRIERNYAREVDMAALVDVAVKAIAPLEPQSGEPSEVFKKAINAALTSLDPHSRYLDARAQSSYRSALTGTFGGLGMEVEMADGLVRVVAPMPDTPAARAGLQRGDLIVRFDGESALGMSLSDATSHMRGDPGTAIDLTIRRMGLENEFTLSLVRETIRTQPLRWSMEGDVLVLRLASFTSSLPAMLEKAMAEAAASPTARAVILDMRGNGGGLLRPAVTVADAFLRNGVIVSLRGRTAGNRRTWVADPSEHLAGVPMIVLIDGRSASAAELVAAALQENGRAIVMGQRSFGKGSVQSIISLNADDGALRLTTALYHGPSGRTVQRTGVGPDIELVSATTSSTRREADRPQALPGADEPLPPLARVDQSRCPLPRPELDPALACALDFVRAGAIDPFLAMLGSRSAEADASVSQ